MFDIVIDEALKSEFINLRQMTNSGDKEKVREYILQKDIEKINQDKDYIFRLVMFFIYEQEYSIIDEFLAFGLQIGEDIHNAVLFQIDMTKGILNMKDNQKWRKGIHYLISRGVIGCNLQGNFEEIFCLLGHVISSDRYDKCKKMISILSKDENLLEYYHHQKKDYINKEKSYIVIPVEVIRDIKNKISLSEGILVFTNKEIIYIGKKLFKGYIINKIRYSEIMELQIEETLTGTFMSFGNSSSLVLGCSIKNSLTQFVVSKLRLLIIKEAIEISEMHPDRYLKLDSKREKLAQNGKFHCFGFKDFFSNKLTETV